MSGPGLVTWQLADSAFPSGAYTLSHGLEGYSGEKAITPEEVPDLLRDLLVHAIGPADSTALAHAHAGALDGDWDRVREADERLLAGKLSREIRQASLRIGRQLLSICGEVFPSPLIERFERLVLAGESPGTQAVVVGVTYAGAGVTGRDAVMADLFAFCSSFSGAALRLRLADFRSAQVLLRGATPSIERATREAQERGMEDIGGCAPCGDIMSARHEMAPAKLFAN